jgi:hypothetical protein
MVLRLYFTLIEEETGLSRDDLAQKVAGLRDRD